MERSLEKLLIMIQRGPTRDPQRFIVGSWFAV